MGACHDPKRSIDIIQILIEHWKSLKKGKMINLLEGLHSNLRHTSQKPKEDTPKWDI